MSLSHQQKARVDTSADITDKREHQTRPLTPSSHPSPKLRSSQSPPPPSPRKIDVACAAPTVAIPPVPPMDRGLAAWMVLLAAVLVQALPFGRQYSANAFYAFPTNPSEF
jgi:hypothetical protein